MTRRSSSTYPPNWPDIANEVKTRANWRCVRCGHAHDPASGHTLTVHHLDLSPANCEWWNLAPLCQKCHLTIQAKVVMERIWYLPHSEWFKPYAAGYYAALHGLPTDRNYVDAHADELIALGQGYIEIDTSSLAQFRDDDIEPETWAAIEKYYGAKR